MNHQTNTDSNDWLDDLISQLEGILEIDVHWSYEVRQKADKAKQAILQKFQEVERLARVDQIRKDMNWVQNEYGLTNLDIDGVIIEKLTQLTPTSQAPPKGRKDMKTATVYRTQAKALKDDTESHNYNESDVPQFELCVFTDGKCAQRWLTQTGSMVWWDSYEDLCKVHIYAHPDYGTRVEWSDGTIDEL